MMLMLEEATERKLITSADGYTDEETTNAHNFIVWNIRTLEKQDILALARQVSALSSYTYSTKMFMKKRCLEKSKRINSLRNETNVQYYQHCTFFIVRILNSEKGSKG